MSWATVVATRLRGLLTRRRLERELDEEVRFHLEMQIEDGCPSKEVLSHLRAALMALSRFDGLSPEPDLKEAFDQFEAEMESRYERNEP